MTDQDLIDRNVDILYDAMVKAREHPDWSKPHTLVSLATVMGKMAWGGAPDLPAARVALERFFGQVRIIAKRHFDQ